MDSFENALKEHYHGLHIKDLVYKKNPLLALMPKYERFGGKFMPVPLKYGNPQGRGAVFGTAQNNASNTKLEAFNISHVRDYSVARIDALTMDASSGDADAFVRAATLEVDSAISSLSQAMALDIFGDGSGVRGKTKDTASSATFELNNTADIVNFEVGMKIIFVAPQTVDGVVVPGALRDSGTAVTITAVNRDTGFLTTSPAPHTNVDTLDFIIQEGDYAVSGDRLKMDGLDAWIPSAAPGAAVFNTVDRSVDTSRLGGVRYDGTVGTMRDNLLEAAARLAREGGSPDTYFVNYANYAALEIELATNTRYDVSKTQDGNFGFTGLTIQGPTGPINVIPDKNCQSSVAWLLQMNTWTLNSAGPAPKILDHDGNRLLRVNNLDEVEIRIGFYGNVSCSAPGWNCRVAL
jgi:hypothetical protein